MTSNLLQGMNNPDEERSAFADMPSKPYSEVKEAVFENKVRISKQKCFTIFLQV